MLTLIYVLSALCIAAGVAGTVLPVVPGAPLVFAGVVLFAWAGDFQQVGWFPIVVNGILMVAALVVDLVSVALGAKRAGASGWAALGASIGVMAGLFFGLPGIIFGPFAGATIGEMVARRDLIQAGKAGLGTWLGFVCGAAAKLALVVSMLAVTALALVF